MVNKYYAPLVCYTYAVDGRLFEGKDDYLDTPTATTAEYAQKRISHYPVGTPVSVHYNPQEPQRSLIAISLGPWQIFGLAMGLGMVICGLVGGIGLVTLGAAAVAARL